MEDRIIPIDEMLVDQLLELPKYSKIFTSIRVKGISLNELSKKIGYPKSSIYYVLKKLMRAGIITKFEGLNAKIPLYLFTLRGLRVYRLLIEKILENVPREKLQVRGRGDIEALKYEEALKALSKYVVDPIEALEKLSYEKVIYEGEAFWVKVGKRS